RPCSTSARETVPLLYCPTAHTSPADTAATPLSWLPSVPTLGLGITDHAPPSQCSTSVRSGPPRSWSLPTAHASLAEIAATPPNWLSYAATLGLGITDQPGLQGSEVPAWIFEAEAAPPAPAASPARRAASVVATDRAYKTATSSGARTCGHPRRRTDVTNITAPPYSLAGGPHVLAPLLVAVLYALSVA